MTDIVFYEQQLAKARREGNRQLMGSYLGSLGNLYANRGEIDKAIHCLGEAKRIRESLHDWDGVALVCKNLAACFETGRGDLRTAVTYLEMAAHVASPDNPEKQTYAAMAAAKREELDRQARG
jgi:tetratricopeptide (TPR) repeat protein